MLNFPRGRRGSSSSTSNLLDLLEFHDDPYILDENSSHVLDAEPKLHKEPKLLPVLNNFFWMWRRPFSNDNTYAEVLRY